LTNEAEADGFSGERIAMKNFTMLLLALTAICVAGCDEIDPPTDIELTDSPEELLVRANAEIVRQAVISFAAANDGLYPANVGVDTTDQGDTLIDLLPNGRLLANPFTAAATEPMDGAAACPGQCGYLAITDDGAQVVGYYISGYGEKELIVELIEDPTAD
jgi:hypothetical protein